VIGSRYSNNCSHRVSQQRVFYYLKSNKDYPRDFSKATWFFLPFFGALGLPLICVSGYAVAPQIAPEYLMPLYLIVLVVVVVAAGAFFFLQKKKAKPAETTTAHQGSFAPIFPSQYGGNTYSMDQQAGVVFFCTQGPLAGKEFPLPVEGTIGDDPQAKIQLPNEKCSAKLSQENGQYMLRSANGQSFTHNDKSTTEAKLSSGDTLGFGKNIMKVQVG
jgi:hypothetical protein